MNFTSNNLTSVGASLIADRFGNGSRAYNFNGTSSYMSSSSSGFPTGNSARTITLWFYDRGNLSIGPDSIASSLFSYGNPYITNTYFEIFHMGNSVPGSINLDFKGSGIASNIIKAAFNSWQFCAFVLDAASNYSIYINGAIAGTGTVNINTGSSSVAHIGVSGSNPWHYFNGKIDDVFIYSRDLSQSEILQIYNINIATTYSWSTGATTNSITVSPTVTTVYTLSATNGFNSCTASATVAVSTCVGVEEFSKEISFSFFPNPVTSQLVFKPEFEMEPGAIIEIRNMLGEKVSEFPFTREIDVSKLTPGVYILNLSTTNKRINYRFVKE